MGFFSKKNEQRQDLSASIAAQLLATTDNMKMLGTAIQHDKNNWAPVSRNPNTPMPMLYYIEHNTDDADLIAALQRHPNYVPNWQPPG